MKRKELDQLRRDIDCCREHRGPFEISKIAYAPPWYSVQCQHCKSRFISSKDLDELFKKLKSVFH